MRKPVRQTSRPRILKKSKVSQRLGRRNFRQTCSGQHFHKAANRDEHEAGDRSDRSACRSGRIYDRQGLDPVLLRQRPLSSRNGLQGHGTSDIRWRLRGRSHLGPPDHDHSQCPRRRIPVSQMFAQNLKNCRSTETIRASLKFVAGSKICLYSR